MDITTGFCDLCIPYQTNTAELKAILKELVTLRYKNIAIEQVYDDTKTLAVKNVDPIPPPVDLDALVKEFKGKLRILSRLTVIYADTNISQRLEKSSHYKKYNIIAAVPTTDAAISHACQNFNCDIIAYSQASEAVKQRIPRKFYSVAVNRDVYFEIKYVPAIKDPDERKDTITRAHQYHMWGRSKNVIITSEARHKFDLRSPYDIAYLGLIFGLTEEHAKSAILSMGRKLLLRAESRRLGKTVMIIRKVQEFGDYDATESESEEDDESDEDMEQQPLKKAKLGK